MQHEIFELWHVNWLAAVVMAVLCIGYASYHRFKGGKWLLPLIGAVVVLVVCFMSPLSLLSQQYLFSAHMAVHVLLLLVVGPMLVMALHRNKLPKIVQKISDVLYRHPYIGWLAGVGIMWIWHVPALFNSAMHTAHHNSPAAFFISGLEIVSLVVAGALFSWPLISPSTKQRLHALAGVGYLFTSCIGCSLLGLLITFAPVGTYNHYLAMHDAFGLNNIITNRWQIDRLTDQQMAGLIMWVPCCFLYVLYSLVLLANWLNQKPAKRKLAFNNGEGLN